MSTIDRSYYDNLVKDAIETISQYGDFKWFVSDDIPKLEEVPWFTPCGKQSCFGCDKFVRETITCKDHYDISSQFLEEKTAFDVR